jgi:hypothetical protein
MRYTCSKYPKNRIGFIKNNLLKHIQPVVVELTAKIIGIGFLSIITLLLTLLLS